METSTCTGLTGLEGLFTFNFFCESLVSSLHTLLHLMEDEKVEIPPKTAELPNQLAEMGSNLLEDYNKDTLDLNRIHQEILDFYELAFHVNDEMAPHLMNSCEDLQYYYSIYLQGINLLFPNIIHGLAHDFPKDVSPVPFMEEISRDFAKIAGCK
ncbi:MAG: hypothetical protein LKF74_02895 [Megasphaera sp.]|jgi:hypothetical protein|nr:hypothetical protein [Megasphaera sp.]MCH4187218.1 hypothetical protein [Megasphaera sp.]MCH4217492.1 hypothetical protein [Megasphaera sp.]